MAEETKGFLEEQPGMKSNIRMMSLIALIASIVFGLVSILHESAASNENGLWITFGFLLAAFAPKALQKFAETKLPSAGGQQE
jgi:hypothetical protein